jgi:hypothetical protein
MKPLEKFSSLQDLDHLLMEIQLCTETYQNQVKNGFARYQVVAGIGGALVKNKTFIISTLNILLILKIIFECSQLGITETVRGMNTFSYIK